MAQAERNKFKDWTTYEITVWIRSFEDFILNSYQQNNLHLYYEALVELYERKPKDSTYQKMIWIKLVYFHIDNYGGTYADFLEWHKAKNQ